ncbi:MAG TPA: MBL fold metallo-hydrolase [Bryobacterales bacterium]|nr:MBL fold metallo-hydrolase [Bryobacterales bacterium]
MHNHSHRSHHADPFSRRDFFQIALGSALAGASVLELGFHRAAWARALAPTASTKLFDIEKVADGVYAAIARAQAMINSNAAIFVNSEDVLVVDAHSKPSAAASLIAQLKKEVTPKPVRFVVNSHFHWDHQQGNAAYKSAESKVDFIASEPTKQLMEQEAQKRLQESLDGVPKQIDALQARLSKASSAGEKAFCREQIRQLQAYQAEMKSFELVLPTLTFARSHVIKDRAHDLHVEFHGHAHTAGDVVVFCPQKRVVATGDMIHGFLPYIGDGYPKAWAKTMDSVAQRDFAQLIGGHGPVQHNRERMMGMKNYIEELVGRVEQGKRAGRSLAELQKTITVASLNSLQANGYKEYVVANLYKFFPNYGPARPLQEDVNINIGEVYKNLDRV